MSRRLRVGFLRIAQETNSFSPVLSTMQDFRDVHWLEGEELRSAISPLAVEAKGFLRNAELTGLFFAAMRQGNVELVPLFSAWAVPSGPLATEAFEGFCERIETSLRRAGKLDALYFCLHGALGAVGVADPESVFLKVARSVLGPNVPIAASHDLHANMTQSRIDATDAIVSYRTNPHRDHVQTGYAASSIAIRAARGEVRPVTAWRSLPMLLGGGRTIDFLSPMRAIFRRMTEMEKVPGVLRASVNMCHPWNADPSLGWSTVVIADRDERLAGELADELAERCWAVRRELPPPFPSAESAIDEARRAKTARKLGTVVFSDASDVVTAGAPGESMRLVDALLKHGKGLLAYAAVRDAVAVRSLFERSEGEVVELTIGGRLDPERNVPFAVKGRIEKLVIREGYGRTALLAIDDVRLVVVEGPCVVMKPEFFEAVGLDCWKADIVVVKNFFPFRLFFLPLARKTIYVRTSGITDLDIALDELELDGPVHPRGRVDEWRTADARRRSSISS